VYYDPVSVDQPPRLHVFFDALSMAEEEYDNIYQYLHCHKYPALFFKDKKKNFRRKCTTSHRYFVNVVIVN